MLRFEGIYKKYEKSGFSLADITFNIERGEIVFLTGKSGAGKTTLLKMAYGAIKPDSGRVMVDGIDIAGAETSAIRAVRRRLGLVFQDGGLIPGRNVYENVAMPLFIRGADIEIIRKNVSNALRLTGMKHREESMPSELSGGETQKAGIARAIVADPGIILADEPTGNVDRDSAKEIINLLIGLSKNGAAVLIASHDREITGMDKGRIVALRGGLLVL